MRVFGVDTSISTKPCPASDPFPIKVKCDLSLYGYSAYEFDLGYCQINILGTYDGRIRKCECTYKDLKKNDCKSKGYQSADPLEFCSENTKIGLDPFVYISGSSQADCYRNGDDYCDGECEATIPNKIITCCADLV